MKYRSLTLGSCYNYTDNRTVRGWHDNGYYFHYDDYLSIFMPVLAATGFDPLLFGVLFLLNIGIALLTPPFGLLIFVIKRV